MGKRQTLTFTKAGADYNQINTDLFAAMNNTTFESYSVNTNSQRTVTHSFDSDTNTLTVIRDWTNDSDYNTYLTMYSSERTTTQTALEADGFTVTESVEDL